MRNWDCEMWGGAGSLAFVGTYLKLADRRDLVRSAAREMLRSGTAFQDLTLRDVADHLGWPLGTLHRAYSITSTLLNDLLLEFEDDTYTAVFLVGDGGLHHELTAAAHRMHAHMEDAANVQMMRYQMTLGCRSEDPHELQLRHTRDSSWEFTRDGLVQISVAAGEEYSDINVLATVLTALRDGLSYQFFSHGQRDRWMADSLRAVDIAVALAQPRKVSARASLGDQRWTADQMPARRRELLTQQGSEMHRR
jgi:AcrR family transcriptional regulator